MEVLKQSDEEKNTMRKIFKIIITIFAALGLTAFVLCLIDWAIRYFLSCILVALLFFVSISQEVSKLMIGLAIGCFLLGIIFIVAGNLPDNV